MEITDQRSGLVHDYTRKQGVVYEELVLPNGGKEDRAKFWNRVELHHKRGDAILVREVEVSLPKELSKDQRQVLAVDFARELAQRYGVAVDLALHAPRIITDRDLKNDPDQHQEIDPETGRRHNGNWHAHMMLSACHVQASGELGKKAVELDPIHCQRAKIVSMVDRERPRWGELANAALALHGQAARMDHRSHAARGIALAPSQHLGPAASGLERRTGKKSQRRLSWEQSVAEQSERAQAAQEAKALTLLEQEREALTKSLSDTASDLRAVLAERDHQLENKREKENEQRIASSVERVRVNIEAASRAGASARSDLLAAKQHLVAATSDSIGIGRSVEGAIQRIGRRNLARDYERVVAAAKRQFERAGSVLQQAFSNIDRLIEPIAASAKYIAGAERAARAEENAKAAIRLRERTDYLALQVASGDKSPAVLKTANEHVAKAKVLEKIASVPIKPPQLSHADKLASSWDAMVSWIKALGEPFQKVDIDTEKGQYQGKFEVMSDLHVIQKVNRAAYSIHLIESLDKAPVLGNVDTRVEYKNGRGRVTGGPDRGKGGIGS